MEVETSGDSVEHVEQEADFTRRFKRPPDVPVQELEKDITETSQEIMNPLDTGLFWS